MTLSTVLIGVAISATILTLLVHFVFNKKKSWVMSYLQNFCGSLFLFSGWVKAVDPLGTGYKNQQYFDQFETVFQDTWFGFLSPLFPILSEYAVAIAVFVIVLELVLGLMLILGHKPKFTAWTFLGLVIFFTILTGFTYLTGYVSGDVNFFEFSKWGEYDANNMKVTDCGCFGDFLVLEPKVSFLKDVFLLIPGFYFLFQSKKAHTLFSKTLRNIVVSGFGLFLIYYCMSNFVWDIPSEANDFRPFKRGVNIGEQKRLEEEAQANVQILAYNMTNKASGEQVSLPYADYLKRYKEFPTEEWELEQTFSEPTMAHTKISEFDVEDVEGNIINDRILDSEGPMIFLVAHKLYGDGSPSTRIILDTIYKIDTVYQREGGFILDRNIERVEERTEEYIDYAWKEFYAQRFRDIVIPFVNEAKADGLPVIAAVGGADAQQIEDLRKDLGLDIQFGTADDILLKTIVRSNPGIVLMDKGVLVNKWHYKKLPSYSEVKGQYLE